MRSSIRSLRAGLLSGFGFVLGYYAAGYAVDWLTALGRSRDFQKFWDSLHTFRGEST